MTSTRFEPGCIIDISQTVSKDIAVWPGDTPFSSEFVMRMDEGCSCNVSTVHMSVHTGTHADSPFHFIPDGKSPAEVDLARYMGPCLVVDVKSEDAVRPADFENVDLSSTPRILFKTPRSTDETHWRDDFTFLSVEAAEVLVAAGVQLVGIDTPSIDAMDSKTLDAHKILSSADTAILENLKLGEVPEGTYELIALPLKLLDTDSSPVRAVLRVMS